MFGRFHRTGVICSVSVSLQNWAHDDSGARGLCACVWSGRSQIWKFHLKLTFTISIIMKGNFVRRTKMKNKTWKSLYSDVRSLGSSAPQCLLSRPTSLRCRDAVGFLSTSGLPFILTGGKKKWCQMSPEFWMYFQCGAPGMLFGVFRWWRVYRAFDFFFSLKWCPEYSFYAHSYLTCGSLWKFLVLHGAWRPPGQWRSRTLALRLMAEDAFSRPLGGEGWSGYPHPVLHARKLKGLVQWPLMMYGSYHSFS